nr:c-type cytochrome biogenesis protein CcmI [Marinicella sp. W31]MDC2876570.1 c-type cytochrome biogenesis protein CcmI [Marinicella sp. W31]
MIFATVALVMFVVAAFVVALPLLQTSGSSADHIMAGQAAVYRDQLREIERERREGLLSEPEYEAARTEIGRRLLAVSDRTNGTALRGRNGRTSRWGAAVAIVIVLLGAGFIYPFVGTPGAPDQPLADRINADEPDLAVLVARVEQHLAVNPDDGRGGT